MKNSRRKGAVGEREWRDVLRAEGFSARRGQQYSGSPDSPDVVCPDLPFIHWEVKRVERLDLCGAMAQARNDAGNQTPIVAHRKNRGDWLVTLRAEDFFQILRESDQCRAGEPQ